MYHLPYARQQTDLGNQLAIERLFGRNQFRNTHLETIGLDEIAGHLLVACSHIIGKQVKPGRLHPVTGQVPAPGLEMNPLRINQGSVHIENQCLEHLLDILFEG